MSFAGQLLAHMQSAGSRFHDAVVLHDAGPATLHLTDRRTGMAVQLISDGSDAGSVEQAFGYLANLGTFEDLPTDVLRVRQRPYRLQLRDAAREASLSTFGVFITTKVPYYREQLAAAPAQSFDAAWLDAMPTLSKSDLRQNMLRLIAEDVDIAAGVQAGTLSWARTSGSTGERLQVLSEMELDRVPPDYEDVWGVQYGEATPRTAVLATPRCTAVECRVGQAPLSERIRFGHTLYLNSTPDLFGASDSLVRSICDDLWEFRPDFLLVNPVYLHWFALRARQLGLALPPVALVLSTYQYLSGTQRRGIAQAFDAPIYNLYSATELGGSQIGVECRRGNWHIREDHVVLEVLDAANRRLQHDLGALHVTTVAAGVMPLLRYRVGDLGRLLDTECDCPLADWQCFEFHGREAETLLCPVAGPGSLVTTHDFDAVVSTLPGIAFYACTQDDAGRITLDLVPDPDMPMPSGEIADAIEAFLQTRVVVRKVARLRAEPSEKHRLIRRG